jgi:DNA-directed RNA polymerase beta subunit
MTAVLPTQEANVPHDIHNLETEFTWSSPEIEETKQSLENIISKTVDQFPLTKVTEVLAKSYRFEEGGELNQSEDGQLLLKYLKYAGLYSDITEHYDQMLDSLRNLILETYITLQNNEIIFFENVNVITDIKTPLYCRQHGLTYAIQIQVTALKGVHVIGPSGNVEKQPLIDAAGNRIAADFILGEIPLMIGSRHCIMNRKKMTEQERFNIGECPNDPVGYFIIDGTEYIIFIQDKLRTNFPVATFEKDIYRVKMTCDNYVEQTKVVEIKKAEDKIYKISVDFLAPEKSYQIVSINVLLIYRILGITDLSEIESMILFFSKRQYWSNIRNELLMTFANLRSVTNDVAFLNEVKGKNSSLTQENFIAHIEKLFPQYRYSINNHQEINALKLYTISMMLAKIVEVVLGIRRPDDRNSWSIKRLVTAGPKMYQLLVLEWKTFIKNAYSNISNIRSSNLTARDLKDLLNNKSKLDPPLKKTFDSSFKTTWGTKSYKPGEKYTDILKRESKLSPLSYINRINTPGSRENKKIDTRATHMTQYGYIDPTDTPEGKEGCGIVKNKAVTAWISTYGDTSRIDYFLIKMNVEGKFFGIIRDPNYAILLLNGRIMGQCDGQYVKDVLTDAKRKALLKKDTMIVFDTKDNIVYVNTDGGRPTRPLLLINPDTGKLFIDELNLWDADVNILLSSGCMEYVDSFEQEFTFIAKSIQDVRNQLIETAEAEKSLANLNSALVHYKETGLFTYGPLDKEYQDKEKSIQSLTTELDRLNYSDATDKKELDIIHQELKDLSAAGIPDIEIRLKYTDVNYKYQRLIKKIKIRKDIRVKLDIQLKDLLKTKTESIDYMAYYNSQLEMLNNNYDKLINKKRYTHCEVSPGAIFGIAASVVPKAEHNPATRVEFQCGMGKQALGIYHSNYLYRFDTTSKMLVTPTQPIMSGQINKLIGLDKYGHGANIILAIMSYTQFNQEDAIILNQTSIDNGKFRMMSRKTVILQYSRQAPDYVEELVVNPQVYDKEEEIKNKRPKKDMTYKYRHLDSNGIAKLESVVNKGDCLVGIRRVYKSTGKVENVSKFVEADYEGYVVDTYGVTTDTNNVVTVKIALRDYRIPIRGDKFASRIAQKSTVGLIMKQADMPFDPVTGIYPDAILNPNAFPSRQTLSHLIEMLVGKAAAITGREVNGASFQKLDLDDFRRILRENGYNEWGYQNLFNGMTGEPFKAEIYMGPIYYQALKHHVKDKIQARQRGLRDNLTGQGTKGRKHGGSIKMGFMESNSIISHGAAGVIHETHCVSSSAYVCVICKTCRNYFDINFITKDKKYTCRSCGPNSDIVRTIIPFSNITLGALVSIMNMNVGLLTKKKEDYE